MINWRFLLNLVAGTAGLFLILKVVDNLDRAYPPPLATAQQVSTEVVDRDGALLRAFATINGRWRLAVSLQDVDPDFVRMLIAYEDHRFWTHQGVDPLAMVRAAGQLLANQRIVSGGSTITMQLARLLEPREKRSFLAKLRQILRAIQIEHRLTKKEILEKYLTLAPYGGNLEGIRAATLSYFGREPKRLRSSQAALLVALPQLPERRRPDRNLLAAVEARDRVLDRMVRANIIDTGEANRARSDTVPSSRRQLPAFAAHLAQSAIAQNQHAHRHQLTIRRSVQKGLEKVARDGAENLGAKVSVAMILADTQTGEILGQTGSAHYFDAKRSGWIDMSEVSRSPGSTLKPLIYGLAFEEGLAAPETIISDRPANFSGYRPRNFDMNYQGDVSVRHALQMSLNVPAVRLLEAIGPARLLSRLRRAGVTPELPKGGSPGLAIGLGGAGLSLRDLLHLYGSFANGGRSVTFHNGLESSTSKTSENTVLSSSAAWHIRDILSGVTPPEGTPHRKIAYKTGTSYGYRDAWSVGYDGRYVLAVWAGRADGASVPGLTGRSAAAPILFEGFAKSGLPSVPFKSPPSGATRIAASELPVSLRRFSSPHSQLVEIRMREPAPEIVYPPQGARIELGLSTIASAVPLVLKLQGGRAPFRWLANGAALPGPMRRRQVTWMPDSSGYSTLTVIDASGRAASVNVFLE